MEDKQITRLMAINMARQFLEKQREDFSALSEELITLVEEGRYETFKVDEDK